MAQNNNNGIKTLMLMQCIRQVDNKLKDNEFIEEISVVNSIVGDNSFEMIYRVKVCIQLKYGFHDCRHEVVRVKV